MQNTGNLQADRTSDLATGTIELQLSEFKLINRSVTNKQTLNNSIGNVVAKADATSWGALFQNSSEFKEVLVKIQGRISRSTSDLPLSLVFELFYSGLRR